jgi:hypothetical protein
MEKTIHQVEELTASIKDYLNNRIESVKFSVAEKASGAVANLSAIIILFIVFLLVLIFASIGLVFALNEHLTKPWMGFEIVAGIYLCFAVILWLARGKMIRLPVLNTLIKQFISSDDENEKDHQP